MSRKRFAIALIAVILVLAAGAAVYYSMKRDKGADTEDNSAKTVNATQQQSEEALETVENESSQTEATAVETEPETIIVNSEEIRILGNSPEYDLRMLLEENGEGKTFIRLEYYLNGAGTVKILDDEAIPEIREIFEKRAGAKEQEGSYSIETALLNAKLAKVYFMVKGEAVSGFARSDLYAISLEEGASKKIFSNTGRYGELTFSRDYRYLGYSYEPSSENGLKESILFEVIDCNIDELIIKNSRIKDVKIGSNINKETDFDYTFKAWHTNSRVRLFQKPVGDEKVPGVEVLYDISSDLMLNLDGTVIEEAKKPEETGPQQGQATEETQVKPDPEDVAALSVLKEFYGFLSSESNYEKAMELLDETFVIRLAIFRQFGINELTKADITAEDATLYSEMLKAARFDTVVAEERKDSEVTIYYYQSIELTPGNAVRQPMSVTLKKAEKGWRIAILQDADESQPPFAAATGNQAN